MTDVRELEDLLYLVRCVVHTRKPELSRVQNMNLEHLYRFSRFHSLAALTYTALESAWDGHPPHDSLPEGWKEARDAAIRNSLLFTAERKALEAFCEERGIWYLPLKGILLQKEYPGLGLREMADNDILYDADFQQQIHDWFVERHYEVVEYRQGVHDTYHKAPVYNFEMHTALFRASQYPEWAAYFQGAVARLLPVEGSRWGRQFTAEDFYLYLLAHMYKHFATSGTGLRSLLDVFLFRRTYGQELNQEILRMGLDQLNLADFDRQICALADRTFGWEESLRPEDADKLAYYLASGTHGTMCNRVNRQLKRIAGNNQPVTGKTKMRYCLQRLFPDRAFMKLWCRHDAPFFLRHPRLMPMAYGYRFIYTLIHGRTVHFFEEQQFLWKQS